MPLGKQVTFESLEAPDGVCRQATHLSEMLRDRQNLLAQAVLDSLADAVRERRLELGRGFGKGFHFVAGALERGLDDRRLSSPFGGLPQPLVRPLDREWIHGSQR